MHLKHVALTCGCEASADKFYRKLLGLEKSEPKTLPSALCKSIFDFDSELVVINYRNEDCHFEIFITEQSQKRIKPIEHVCLEVDDLNDFYDRCRTLGVETTRVRKGHGILTFIKDFDGNLFEVKGGQVTGH